MNRQTATGAPLHRGPRPGPIGVPATANRRTALKLGVVAVGMFGVGYALAPLYDVLCDAMGLNGKTTRVATMEPTGPVDATRTVTVELTGQAMAGLPWEFRPLTAKLDVHPGETVEVKYYARNRAAEAITGQAVPSVTPGRAASHFQKIECFCFSQQTLAAGEGREMPVRFTVSPKLNPDVHTITLSYAFFNTDKTQAARYGASPGKQAMPAQVQHAHHAGG